MKPVHRSRKVTLAPVAAAKPAKPKGDVYAKPTPKVSRLRRGKVLSAEERAAFLKTRPDLK
jgi:hypothetical protein